MKSLLSIALLFFGIQAYCQIPLKTNANLNQVLVYRSGAEMNHKAKINLPQGSSEVVINNVANTIDEKTIQVGSNANITILSVRFAKDYMKDEIKIPEYIVLEDSVKSLKKAMAKFDIQRQAEQSVLDLLDKNSTIGGANTGVSITELMKLADYYKAKQLEVSSNISKIDEQANLQQVIISKLELQMLELRSANTNNGGQIILQVIAKNAATTDFNISYISPNAGWNAFYDLRADKINEPLKLSYKANVVQNTGIDWKKVKLILSTGNPTISGTAPDMNPWFLAFQQEYKMSNYGSGYSVENAPISDVTRAFEGAAPGLQITSGYGSSGSGANIQIRGRGSITESTKPLIVLDGSPYDGDITSISPSDISSMTVLKDNMATSLYGARGTNGVIVITTKNKSLSSYTTQSENDLNTTFDIDIPYDIASNAKPNTVSLQEYKMPAQYQYLAIPKLDPDAFLMANITDYGKLNLLPGEGNILFENMYVGKSFINPGSTNDTLNLSMGRDKQIIVKREKVAESSGTKFLGSNRKQTFTYEIKVRNNKKDAINLTLKDQYPVSTDKDLEIELLQSDEASVNKETGELTWKLNIPSGETKKVRISYSVKYPTDKVLANL
jgi:TonB-dependent SusC/RagA subfamily outer membrane receptor